MKENNAINRGWLSLELTGVLLIIIVAIIGVVAWIGGAFAENDTSNELANINSIMTNTRGLLKGSTGYDYSSAANMTGTLVEYGGVPSTMSIHGTASSGTATVTNIWGGAVTVQPETISGTTGAGFSVTYEKVPQQACTTLTTKLSSGSMVTQTTINGTVLTGEVSPAQAAGGCVADDGGAGSNTIILQSDS
ncbi:type 4 pilus major pilin [Citrobacter koseri]|uniref:type 4 pilus major pilin n=1 Tax=Citrobacter koseri TaxID=545 RepID=UPI001F37A383|nr:type 4 pilus major pilin [Citrobacter koseri]